MKTYYVLNENTLGFKKEIEDGKILHILHASALKGAKTSRLASCVFLSESSELRLATMKDFEEFRCALPREWRNA